MMSHVSADLACDEVLPARVASGPPWRPMEEWPRLWRSGMERRKWRRTAAMLLGLDPRIARDMGFEPQALRYALELGWTEAETRHYSRADL
jgi:hypothetical protein